MHDIKFEMDTCFPDDSALGQLLDEYAQAAHAGDWATANQIIGQTQAPLNEDLKSCEDNQKVMDGFNAMYDVLNTFLALDNWEDIMQQNLQDNLHIIEGYGA